MSDEFYASVPDEGVTLFDSEEEAREHCEDALERLAEESSEGWNENMDDLHWGRLVPTQFAKQVNERKAPPSSEFDTMCDYVLAAVPS